METVTEEDLAKLSTFGKVAIAARCAIRVSPIVEGVATENEFESLKSAMLRAVHYAEGGGGTSDSDSILKAAEAAARSVELAALEAEHNTDHLPKAALKARKARAVKAAACAAKAIVNAFGAVHAALSAGIADLAANEITSFSFEAVRAASTANAAAIASKQVFFLGDAKKAALLDYKYLLGKQGPFETYTWPLWPDEDESPSDISEPSIPRFSLKLSFPAEWTDDKVKAHTLEVIKELDATYRECGGDGLKVNDIQLFDLTRELA